MEDRSKAIAFELEQAQTCQVCGTSAWEWEEDQFAYEVIDEFCRGCYQLEYMQDAKSKEPGHRLNLSPARTVAAAQRQLAAVERDKARSARSARGR